MSKLDTSEPDLESTDIPKTTDSDFKKWIIASAVIAWALSTNLSADDVLSTPETPKIETVIPWENESTKNKDFEIRTDVINANKQAKNSESAIFQEASELANRLTDLIMSNLGENFIITGVDWTNTNIDVKTSENKENDTIIFLEKWWNTEKIIINQSWIIIHNLNKTKILTDKESIKLINHLKIEITKLEKQFDIKKTIEQAEISKSDIFQEANDLAKDLLYNWSNYNFKITNENWTTDELDYIPAFEKQQDVFFILKIENKESKIRIDNSWKLFIYSNNNMRDKVWKETTQEEAIEIFNNLKKQISRFKNIK